VKWWSKLPEAVRWILLVPAVLACLLVVNAVFLLAASSPFLFGRHPSDLLVGVIQSALSAGLLFPVLCALTPRAKSLVAWIHYIILGGFAGIVLALLILRRLASWGLLGDVLLPPSGVEGWEARDWIDLAQTATYLVVGTLSFRGCLLHEKTKMRGSTANIISC